MEASLGKIVRYSVALCTAFVTVIKTQRLNQAILSIHGQDQKLAAVRRIGMRKCTVSVYYVIGNKITDMVVFSISTSSGETPNSGIRISGPNKEIELRPNIEQVAGTWMVTSQGCQDYLDVIFHGHCRPIFVTRVCSRTGNENCFPFSFNSV